MKFLHSDLLKKDEGKRSAISIKVFYLWLSKLCRALVYNLDPKCIYWLSFLCKKVLQKLPDVQILKRLSAILDVVWHTYSTTTGYLVRAEFWMTFHNGLEFFFTDSLKKSLPVIILNPPFLFLNKASNNTVLYLFLTGHPYSCHRWTLWHGTIICWIATNSGHG